MGDQLDLLGFNTAKPPEPSDALSEEQLAISAVAESLPGQLNLFGDRWQRASAAHKALESFDLDAAAEALRGAVRLYPSDAALLDRANLIANLAVSLRSAQRKNKSPARGLVAIEPKIPAFLATYWHRRLAEVMEEEDAPGAVLACVPAGLHWLRAGDSVRAEASLRATLALEPANCRARAYLADTLFVQGRQPEARLEYRQALATSPADVDLASLADDAVRGLPDQAKNDYELPGAPIEWSAAVGLLDGVFLSPSHIPENWTDPPVLDSLAPGLRFYRWFVAEKVAGDHARRIACRRAMKALSPRLLAEYVERRS